MNRVSESILLISILTISCTKVPITGRSQLTGLYNSQQVIQMSAEAYEYVLDSLPLSQNEEQVAMIKRVGNKIRTAVEQYMNDNGYTNQLEGFDWQFNLIDNDTTVNAWAMAGGKVAFYTGILPICQDDLGVAVVMGHEVAHAIAKHSQERMNQIAAQQGILSIGSILLGDNPGQTSKTVFEGAGLFSNLGILSFSRTHESEADELGLTFMAIAGYDPREAPKFWERMSSGGGSGVPEFLSTHPSHDTRIRRLNEAMPKALEFYQGK